MPQTFRNLNALALLGINLILCFAFYDQFIYQELPCPLCLLQRVGFVAFMFGTLMNIQYGPKPSHYGFMLISAIFGAIVALRQVSLHVIPGTPGYGNPFMGLHFYTWAFITFSVMLLITSLVLMFEVQYEDNPALMSFNNQSAWIKGIIILSLMMIFANIASAFFECGFGACQDNPKNYEMLKYFQALK